MHWISVILLKSFVYGYNKEILTLVTLMIKDVEIQRKEEVGCYITRLVYTIVDHYRVSLIYRH